MKELAPLVFFTVCFKCVFFHWDEWCREVKYDQGAYDAPPSHILLFFLHERPSMPPDGRRTLRFWQLVWGSSRYPPSRGQNILAPSVSIPLVDAYTHRPRVGVKPERMSRLLIACPVPHITQINRAINRVVSMSIPCFRSAGLCGFHGVSRLACTFA